jgi:hypothetical protein
MANESKNLIIPHGWLKLNSILPASSPELPASYSIDCGQFENSSIDIGGEIKENFTGLGGIIGLDKAQRVRATLTYTADAKYITAAIMDYIFGGTGVATIAGVAPEIGKVYDLFGWFGMQANNEPIRADGTGLFVHHSFQAGITFDGPLTLNGSDFLMSKLTARVYLGVTPGKWSRAATRPLPASA